MSWRIEKETGDIVISGFEKGVAPSPLQGIGNMQSVNISDEMGEVFCSYARVQQSFPSTSPSSRLLTPSDSTHLTISSDPSSNFWAGNWITTGTSTIAGLSSSTTYYILSYSNNIVQLATTYNGAAITGLGATGTCDFAITTNCNMVQPVASTTEFYSNGSAFKYRYYILDTNGHIWVRDTGVVTDGIGWFLPDRATLSNPTGIAVLNGWVLVFAGNTIYCKSTVILGQLPSNPSTTGWDSFAGGNMMSPATSPNPHFAFAGRQGKCYYTDGNFLGSIFPNTSLQSGVSNIQSYASYTAVTTTGTISTLISGARPTTAIASSTTRIPAFLFSAGTKPAAITLGTIYWILMTGAMTFEVYAASSGGSALDIETGSAGTQYFNTFYPASSGGMATITFTPQRFNLPVFETAQCVAELGNTVLIGCKGNVLYPWNQVDVLPSNLIPIPENNVSSLLTVSSMVYVFAGSKGNIYVTNGSAISAALTLPSYVAGIAGSQSSYVDPYFVWGGTMFLRGRVYFSVLDQTADKTGNTGGIWSFVPSQNINLQQEQVTGLRMENKSSYETFNGVCTVLLASQDQNAKGPQYWSAWYSSITSATYGIDFSNTIPYIAVIETDLIPTGTALIKKTLSQIEYKLSAPLIVGESVALTYRQNATDNFASLGTLNVESTTSLSGYYTVNFEKGQWLQIKATLTPTSVSTGSFIRLAQIRIR